MEYTTDYLIMKIMKTFYFLCISAVSLFLGACLSNYSNAATDIIRLMKLVDQYEYAATNVVFEVPSEELFLAAERVLQVDNTSLSRFRKSHGRLKPNKLSPKWRYKDNEAGVLVATVRRGRAFSNIGIIYIYPSNKKTTVKVFSNNKYEGLFATSNQGLINSLKRAMLMRDKAIEIPKVKYRDR